MAGNHAKLQRMQPNTCSSGWTSIEKERSFSWRDEFLTKLNTRSKIGKT